MGYVERVLQPGEDIKHVSRLHWIVYWRGLVLIIIGLIGFILFIPGQSNPIAPTLMGVVFLLGLVSLFQALFKRWTTEIAVTNRRTIYKRGFIRQS